MIKYFTVASVFLFSIYASAFPFGIGPKKAVKKDTKTKMECANFSGDWVGVCTSPLGTSAINTKIAQYSCDSFELDSNLYYLGGARTVVNSSKFGSDTDTRLTRWKDESKQRIEFKDTFNTHDFSINDIYADSSKYEVYLHYGEQLKVDGEITVSTCTVPSEPGEPTDPDKKDCEKKVMKITCTANK